ncbi:MAG: homoserine O-acetyltransferase [Nitrospinae bacterium]|nr:homoserine O-acetyltransferase [Nitrospinota bacterium]
MTTKRQPANGPDAPDSVGWVKARRMRIREADNPMPLEVGGTLGPVDLEYETYGRLSRKKDNVILVCHALSGDAHAAGWDAEAKNNGGRSWRANHPGWWDTVIGPGKALDTDRYFVICVNYLGSCYGTTGPSSVNPATGKPYGASFPMVTVGDWVRSQAELLDRLGVEKLVTVVGGSLGGQQAIEWGLRYPDRTASIMVLAASPRLSAQGLGFNAVGRYCIMNDPAYAGGAYYDGPAPASGLAAARMLAHITYLSEEGMHAKFGRRLRNKAHPDFHFDVEFEVESYLSHQGLSFVQRFDANSYLYITRAMDYYDPAQHWGKGDLTAACKRLRSKVMVVSFSSDWLYTPKQCREFAWAVARAGAPVTYGEIPSLYGHDAFLVETEQVSHYLRSFLDNLEHDRPKKNKG